MAHYAFGGRQLLHMRHAQIARRANLSHVFALATSGKSERCFRASRLDEEGRYGQSSRHVRRGCDGRGWHVRRTGPARTAKSRGPGLPTLRSSLATMLCITPATGARKPGPRGDRDISRKPSRRECRLIRLNLWRLPPAFFVAGGPWVRSSPGIPCALSLPEGRVICTTRARTRRGMGILVPQSRFRCCAKAPTRASHPRKFAAELKPPLRSKWG